MDDLIAELDKRVAILEHQVATHDEKLEKLINKLSRIEKSQWVALSILAALAGNTFGLDKIISLIGG
jgi:hypothetical protein